MADEVKSSNAEARRHLRERVDGKPWRLNSAVSQ